MDTLRSAYTHAWNSHIAALAHVCRAAAHHGNEEQSTDTGQGAAASQGGDTLPNGGHTQGYRTADVAGITGAAFRTALCEGATPPGLYLSWSFPHYFVEWFDALGLDAAVLWHPAGAPGAACWLKRARDIARRSLDMGYPVVYWDNLAFSVITGLQGERFLSSGIMRDALHPVLADPATDAPYLPRLAGPDRAGPFELNLSLDELAGPFNDDLFFACPLGLFETARETAAIDGIVRCARELAGHLDYPRRYSAPGLGCTPHYGLPALERLVGELKQGRVHHFGLVQFIQSQAEGRRWGVEFLRRAAALPGASSALEPDQPEAQSADAAPLLSQAAVFIERSLVRWNELARRFDVPFDAAVQLSRESLTDCAEHLYQIHRTEETACRLLASVANEIAH